MTVWDDLVGQEPTIETLSRAVADESAMTHAWLFTGPPGSGRSTAARAFAAALQCPEGGCGQCRECRTALDGRHADVKVVATEGLSIKVAEARALVQEAALRPSVGRWRIIIIEDADRLTSYTDAPDDALLKALEEPTPRTGGMLCAPPRDARTRPGADAQISHVGVREIHATAQSKQKGPAVPGCPVHILRRGIPRIDAHRRLRRPLHLQGSSCDDRSEAGRGAEHRESRCPRPVDEQPGAGLDLDVGLEQQGVADRREGCRQVSAQLGDVIGRSAAREHDRGQRFRELGGHEQGGPGRWDRAGEPTAALELAVQEGGEHRHPRQRQRVVARRSGGQVRTPIPHCREGEKRR